MLRPLLAIAALVAFFAPALPAQTIEQLALDQLRGYADKQGYVPTDLADLRVKNSYASPNGVQHVILGQYANGFPIFNAQAGLHYKDGKLGHRTLHLINDLERRISATAPGISAATALQQIYLSGQTELVGSELVYYPHPDNQKIPLAWKLTVERPAEGKFYLHLVDAVTGEELLKKSLTLSCEFSLSPGPSPQERGDAPMKILVNDDPYSYRNQNRRFTPLPWRGAGGEGATYHVFPFGLESPLYGDRQRLTNPADFRASPFGWHDTDGRPGAEYTITRGNNVYAYRDATSPVNRPDSGIVADGGPELDFDFFYEPFLGPDTVVEASLTQAFYLTNMMHDWSYTHGFDEAAGNFQENNYGRGGDEGDVVRAEVQDGSRLNNADFTTLEDGFPPRMQMFLWSNASLLTVTEPANLSGARVTGPAEFGPTIGTQPTSGKLAIARGDFSQPEFACGNLVNPESLRGNIALITRGECFFQEKAYKVQQAGAIAAIICNPENNIITMAELDEPNPYPVSIPTLMLLESDCIPLRQAIVAGETVSVNLRDNNLLPRDGAFDNGVVAHEYAHGISNRLVGGPGNALCLTNDENMGEGWSDFFLLASTPRSSIDRPDGTEPRGIANFSSSSAPDGRGIRNQYYSTDPTVNTLTYDDIITVNIPHGLGEVWAATLWDIYWAMVDRYGFDDDLINGDGGNNAAVRLVIEGMKFTPCDPGFVEARDALLVADESENNGDNRCMLWEIFAKRGLGFSATQGSGLSRGDGFEAFDVDPSCIPTVKLDKRSDRTSVDAGEEVTYTLTVRNDKESEAQNITIVDEIPAGMTLIAGSVRGASRFSLAANRLTLELASIAPDGQGTIDYRVTTDPARASLHTFFDGMESEASEDTWESLSNGGNQFWELTDTTPYAGQQAWYLVNSPIPQDQTLQLLDPIRVSGGRPALRFFTKYDTEAGLDAGIVQISTDNGTSWQNVDEQFLRFRYRGLIDQRGTLDFRNTPTFWGDSRGYQDVIIDLSEYRGRDILVRYRFVADELISERGWWIDNVVFIQELENYDGLATLTTATGDTATASVGELGVVINSVEETTNVVDPALGHTSVIAYPNPASEVLTVGIEAALSGTATLELFSLDGRKVMSQLTRIQAGPNAFDLPVAELPAGVYLLRVSGSDRVATLKITVE